MTSLRDTVTSQSSSKYVIGYFFGSIYRRDFKFSLYEIMCQGPSNVTLTLIVDHIRPRVTARFGQVLVLCTIVLEVHEQFHLFVCLSVSNFT